MYCKIVPFGLFAAAGFDAGCGLDGSVVRLGGLWAAFGSHVAANLGPFDRNRPGGNSAVMNSAVLSVVQRA